MFVTILSNMKTAILFLIISLMIVITTGFEEEIDCGPVQNLTIIETDFKMAATWDPPLGHCCFPNGLYNIEITVNEFIQVSRLNTREQSVEIDKESCKSYRFRIQSIRASGQPLQWTNETKKSRIAGNGKIEGLEIINDNILSWRAPHNNLGCDIRYIINIDPVGFESTEKIVLTTNSEIHLIPCGIYSISVTTNVPESNNWMAAPVTIPTIGPIKKLSPRHSSTWPNATGARINWVEEEEVNACEIKGIVFGYVLTKLKDTQKPHIQNFEISDDSWYQLDGMEEDEEYSYMARWKLAEAHFGEDSSTINFLTKELTSPVINRIDSEVTSDGYGLRIHWNQSYPVHFVTKHIITVTDMGYNDKELSVWRFENKPNVKTVMVSPVFANHRYNIDVQTIYGHLNAYTSDSTNFNFERDIDRPGKAIEISGTKNVSWTIRFSILDSRKFEN